MPELPEVETTLKGITPSIIGQKIIRLIVRQGSLRWPVTPDISNIVQQQTVIDVSRRAKYLILKLSHGSILVHLGMSGSLRISKTNIEWRKHDHIEMQLANGATLRYHDPRRFGCWLWSEEEHHQLEHLGPEPLTSAFNGDRLWTLGKSRKIAVKPFIMDNKVVVGVGNIYASEALFRSGIRPDRAAGRVSKKRYQVLGEHIKEVLAAAIEQGGTTLRDLLTATASQDIFSKPSQSMVAQAKNVMPVVPYLKSCDSASVAPYFAQPVSASVG